MHILGVRIDNLTKREIVKKIELFLSEQKFHQIATVNPEFILQAQKDKEFKNILNSCELNVADGIGIWYAFIRNFSYLKARVAGADLMHEILYLAYLHNLKVFIAINREGLSNLAQIKETLEQQYPTLDVEGEDMDPDGNYKQIETCDILLSNFGASKQEKFLNFQKNGTIRLAMGVGSSFDYLTGALIRAPRLWRFLGLEWLWRFFLQPYYDKKNIIKRWNRILSAVLIFPIRVIIKK